ncbi:MAG: ABC transporter substrate-binding protein [Actinomycetota bacterium]
MSTGLALALVLAAGCSGSSATGQRPSGNSKSGAKQDKAALRLGYFPNLTHAAALVGLQKGLFEKALGSTGGLDAKSFNSGPDAVTALFSDALDAAYIGPGPAINAFSKSRGKAIRILSGSTEGGAFLVVKPTIASASDLKGSKLASPQLGNTQDIALRTWLKSQKLTTDLQGGGDVSITPQENAQTLEAFRSGQIQGAWVPEPWASRLVAEAGAVVLVDERDLWPDKRFPTTILIVRTEFERSNPAAVEALLKAHLEATAYLNSNSAEAQTLVNKALLQSTGKAIPAKVITSAWDSLSFTTDVVPSSFDKLAANATALGLLPKTNLKTIFKLGPLERARQN